MTGEIKDRKWGDYPVDEKGNRKKTEGKGKK